MEEILAALDWLVQQGKVRYLGASSMCAWEFQKCLGLAERNGWARFVSMQNHYNLAYREEEREMIPLCLSEGLGLLPWSPLARGFLSGSRKRDGEKSTARAKADPFADEYYFRPDDFDVLDALLALAERRGVKPATLAIAWLLAQPGVVAPIVGATKLQYIEDAVAALELKLNDDELAALEAPYRPHPVIGHEQPSPRDVAGR